MKELRFDKVAVKKVHIFGEDYECREPSVLEQFKYEEDIQNKGDKDVVDVVLNYVESLGVPRKAAMKLTSSDILKLIKFISEPEDKKK